MGSIQNRQMDVEITVGTFICILAVGWVLAVVVGYYLEERRLKRKPTAEELAYYKAHSERQDIIMAMTKLQSQGLYNEAAELEKQLGE